MREAIIRILDTMYSTGQVGGYPNSNAEADKILTLLSDSIKDIEWVGECDYRGAMELGIGCPKCNGTITRPATIEEVTYFIKEALYHKTVHPHNIIINGGTLRIKEEV